MAVRNQIPNILGLKNISSRLKRDVNLLVTRAKQTGIIEIPSQNNINISKNNLNTLTKIALFLEWINLNETENIRSSEETSKLIDSLLITLLKNKKFEIVALLCPSYKKGVGTFGFNTTIGESTKKGIHNTALVKHKLTELGFNVNTTIIFGDLVLENYEEISKNNLWKELEENIKSAEKYTKITDPEITFLKLSEYADATKKIPIEGINGEPNLIDKQTYDLVLKRNKNFYINQFGWNNAKVVQRTKILACTYPVLGEFFRDNFKNFLFVYTANSLERARMYQGNKEKSDPIPIFFPKKNSSN